MINRYSNYLCLTIVNGLDCLLRVFVSCNVVYRPLLPYRTHLSQPPWRLTFSVRPRIRAHFHRHICCWDPRNATVSHPALPLGLLRLLCKHLCCSLGCRVQYLCVSESQIFTCEWRNLFITFLLAILKVPVDILASSWFGSSELSQFPVSFPLLTDHQAASSNR